MAVKEKKDANGKVRRMVRKKASVPRSRSETRSSWACVRAAGATEEPLDIGYRPPPRKVYADKAPILRRTYAQEISEPIEPPRILLVLWEKASRLLKATRRVVGLGERKGLAAAVLLAAAAAFAGGLIVQYVFNPVVTLLAYLAAAQAVVEKWLSPATRSTLIAGGILVGIGLWLVLQMLRKPADAVQCATCRDKPVIPKEMLDRHA
ncbi:hypothetical protein ACP3TJ_09945 [Desulforudis sp. 1088]|uniref:hypothetical protein n=1 Tax=unclassified Candidatus Desulforudis TaxID=2635950 RepID=UPI00346E1E10